MNFEYNITCYNKIFHFSILQGTLCRYVDKMLVYFNFYQKESLIEGILDPPQVVNIYREYKAFLLYEFFMIYSKAFICENRNP